MRPRPRGTPPLSLGYAQTLSVDLRRSPTLAALLVVMHAAMLAALMIIAPLMPVISVGVAMTLAFAVTAASAVYYLRREAWRNLRHAVTGIRHCERQFEIRLAGDGAWRAVTVTELFLHPWATVMRVRVHDTGRMLAVVLMPDMLSAETFVQLRGRLRFARGADTRAGDGDFLR